MPASGVTLKWVLDGDRSDKAESLFLENWVAFHVNCFERQLLSYRKASYGTNMNGSFS